MIAICAGMVRSGSTWAYNAAACLLENAAAVDAVRDGYHESFEFLTEPDRIESESVWRVVKSHHLDREAIDRLRSIDPKYIRVIYTYRDVAEAALSGNKAFDLGFDNMYGSIDASLTFFNRLKAIVPICAIPYAALNMESAFSVLVDYLGIEVSGEKLLDIQRKLSRETLTDYVNRLDWRSAEHVERRDGYMFDQHTLLHRNHFTYTDEDRFPDQVVITEDPYGSHANEIFNVDFARIER